MRYELWVGHESLTSTSGYEREIEEFEAPNDEMAITVAEELAPKMAKGLRIVDQRLIRDSYRVKVWDFPESEK